MASPPHIMGHYQTKSDSMPTNASSASTSTTPPLEPPFSPRHTTLKLDCSSVTMPPTSPINEPYRPNTSPEVVRGLRSLGLDMPQRVTAKVAAAYTSMLPMERFLAETCNVDEGAYAQNVVGSSKTSSCQANAGSFKSE